MAVDTVYRRSRLKLDRYCTLHSDRRVRDVDAALAGTRVRWQKKRKRKKQVK